MDFVLSAVIGYAIGSLPTAYLILKIMKGIDIRNEGSGNIGAFNSFVVSDSKLMGLAVLVIDFAKGFVSVYLTSLFFDPVFIYPMTALFFAVLAHCYSPWLKFKGGRGLATATGGAALLAPLVLLIWAVFWTAAFIFKRNIIFGNFTATVLSIAIALTSSQVLNKYANPPAATNIEYSVSISLMLLIILLRHIEPIKKWFRPEDKMREENE